VFGKEGLIDRIDLRYTRGHVFDFRPDVSHFRCVDHAVVHTEFGLYKKSSGLTLSTLSCAIVRCGKIQGAFNVFNDF